jgi:hypothetical protein
MMSGSCLRYHVRFRSPPTSETQEPVAWANGVTENGNGRDRRPAETNVRKIACATRWKLALGLDPSQRLGLTMNIDGSVDLYFGPKALEGKEKRWV